MLSAAKHAIHSSFAKLHGLSADELEAVIGPRGTFS